MFTHEHTLNEIFSDPKIAGHFNYVMPDFFLQIVPKKYRDLLMKELPQKIKMPWGAPYMAADVVKEANRLTELMTDHETYEFCSVMGRRYAERLFSVSL